MEAANARVELTESEALCLEAIRAGLEGNSAIALKIKRDLKTVCLAATTGMTSRRTGEIVDEMARRRAS